MGKSPFKASDTVVAAYGISGYGDGGESVTLAGGTEVPGDHPLVRANPAVFVLRGTPRGSWPHPLEESTRAAVQQEATRRRLREFDQQERRRRNPALDIPADTPIDQLVRCHTRVDSSPFGPCKLGEVRRKDDELVLAHPEFFQRLTEALT